MFIKSLFPFSLCLSVSTELNNMMVLVVESQTGPLDVREGVLLWQLYFVIKAQLNKAPKAPN